jgi:hypothetical protein
VNRRQAALKQRIAAMTWTRSGHARMAPCPDEAELRGLGITRFSSERFHVGPNIYSNPADAVAQAKRGRAAGNDR